MKGEISMQITWQKMMEKVGKEDVKDLAKVFMKAYQEEPEMVKIKMLREYQENTGIRTPSLQSLCQWYAITKPTRSLVYSELCWYYASNVLNITANDITEFERY